MVESFVNKPSLFWTPLIWSNLDLDEVVEAIDGAVTTAKRPVGPAAWLPKVGGKSSILTDELESENSEPPEAKLASEVEVIPEPTRSIHFVIIGSLFKVFCLKVLTIPARSIIWFVNTECGQNFYWYIVNCKIYLDVHCDTWHRIYRKVFAT